MRGGCLCGDVRYEVRFRRDAVYYCHCSQCRRASGSSFATNVPVERRDLAVTAGESLVKAFESSPGKRRNFCSRCGSPLYSEYRNEPDTVYLRVGTVDDPGDLTACAHIHTDSKSSWYEINDGLTEYPEDTDVRRFPDKD